MAGWRTSDGQHDRGRCVWRQAAGRRDTAASSPYPISTQRVPKLPRRVFTLLHDARPVLLNFGEPGGFDVTPWADRVQLIDADYVGMWELPVLGAVTAPAAVLIRPDGYIAWVGDGTDT